MTIPIALLIAFLLPLLLSLLFTPWVMQLAVKLNAIDHPDKRKVHTNPVPRFGGLSVAASFFIATILFYYLLTAVVGMDLLPETTIIFVPGIISILLILLLGAWDDIKVLNPGIKFLIQFAAATLAYVAGFKISLVSDPFSSGLINLQLLSYPLTVLWIVGITNAFNLIDGLDGLASGTAIIALTTIGTISFFHNHSDIVFFCLLLAGSVAGFLWYNFRPARIFLGDSGSLFLGFVLALLSIQSYTKVSASFAIFVPFFALGLPIIDTCLSMTRRFLFWFLPDKYAITTNGASFKTILHSIFQPDKAHIHHQLIQRGLSHKHTVLVLYVVSAVFGLSAVAIALTTQANSIIFLLVTITAFVFSGIQKLKYKEIALFHNGIFLTLYNKLLIKRHDLQKVFDSIFILVAFTAAFLATQPGSFSTAFYASGSDLDLSLLFLVFFIQGNVFLFSGLYRETIYQLGIADVYHITKVVGLSILITATVLYFSPFWDFSTYTNLCLLNFYFLGTLILGIRILFPLLKYLFRRSRQGREKVLIYGTGERGVLILQQLLCMRLDAFTPVGFLDENPDLEGKYINGFPVFGGHWKLEHLIRKEGVRQLIISEDEQHLNPRVRKRIESIASDYNIKVKKFQIHLNEFPLYQPTPDKYSKKKRVIHAKK